MKMRKHKRKLHFSLVELFTVLLINLIIAALIFPTFFGEVKSNNTLAANDLQQNEALKEDLMQIEKALDEINQDESKGLYSLAKVSFKIDQPVLQRSAVETVLLGLMKNKHPQTSAYRQAVKKRLGERFIAFTSGSDFVITCLSCQGEGHTKIDCKSCVGGECKNNSCSAGSIIYKGLNGKKVKKTCPTCKGKGACTKCTSGGNILLRCRQCSGKGKIITYKNVPKLYNNALSQLRKLTKDINNDLKSGNAILSKSQQTEINPPQVSPYKQRQVPRKTHKPVAIASQVKPQKTPPHLKLVLEEFYDHLKAKQRQSGITLASRLFALDQDSNGNYTTTLYLTASDDFIKNERREDFLIGLYEFWKLRCGSNRVLRSGGACIILLDKNESVIAVAYSAEDIKF
ncbi:hypothetical protein PQO03_08450 [Lentisphaera profundi]|uniref:CR-type domain-containing protein n=1 Tax=Lentisphaera profundi TaxID=1658616 RepID=A0ABY7VQZ6_9BACT|nr:hypothetical protein [Lentisphaera profundi]WDE95744.1 hypothetical protein PQO03_08450 [Lentisphaera profundi]